MYNRAANENNTRYNMSYEEECDVILRTLFALMWRYASSVRLSHKSYTKIKLKSWKKIHNQWNQVRLRYLSRAGSVGTSLASQSSHLNTASFYYLRGLSSFSLLSTPFLCFRFSIHFFLFFSCFFVFLPSPSNLVCANSFFKFWTFLINFFCHLTWCFVLFLVVELAIFPTARIAREIPLRE